MNKLMEFEILQHALYDIKLGERYAPNQNTMYTRVPGGWVYGDLHGTCFIPWDNEYQPTGGPSAPDNKLKDGDMGRDAQEG